MKTNDPSRLAIGTVQFGLDYGISNAAGRTNSEEVHKILKLAQKYGVSTIDTASAYGQSEEILGKFNMESWQVVSKFPTCTVDSFTELFTQSLNRLRIEKIYGYLAHNASVLLQNPSLWQSLKKLKDEGKVDKIGYSLYSPSELEELIDMKMIPDLIQIPYNILDRRFESKFDLLKSLNVEIHTRSSFLQGLFFMNPESLPTFFNPVKPFLQRLNADFPDLSTRAGALINFCLSQIEIDRVVIGVNNSNQLNLNINALHENHILSQPDITHIPENILNPSKWPNQ